MSHTYTEQMVIQASQVLQNAQEEVHTVYIKSL